MRVLEPDHKQKTTMIDGPLQLERVRDGLATRRLGTRVHYFSEIGSTNAYAKRFAEQGAGEGEIVLAEAQTRGRGRLGRPWVSPPFVNLYFSVILRPQLPPIHAPQITLMAAVALADTISRFNGSPPAIKWPNDILVGGKKLAGVLTESACDSGRIAFVILGVGVNLNYPAAAMPDEIRERATSMITLTRTRICREAFLRRLIQDLDRCYGELQEGGFASLALRWEAFFGLRGKKVRAEMIGEVLIGTAKGIDRDGALIIEDEQGKQHRIVAGDVIPVEE
jgi:BirA family transcriptional regulator, biotin operon repressor / biotin---[acetyl-CoA-carboxylase] ligase